MHFLRACSSALRGVAAMMKSESLGKAYTYSTMVYSILYEYKGPNYFSHYTHDYTK
jgi:hypothetical protein